MKSLTIGEVLNRLKDEFSDITISKIRFLEAEGLISPDRTESGYRKFTGEDIDRLRYVLRAQRDRYLPLRVIKDELARLDAGLPVAGAPGEEPASAPSPSPDTGEASPPVDAPASVFDLPAAEVQLTSAELADATGLTGDEVTQLRDHGLLGPGPTHDGHDLQVAKLAASLLGGGLEVRHLRMYRQFADREAALAEQLVSPLLRQRNPDSRRSAVEQAERVVAAGGALHQALLARQLRALLGP
ncbi:transcriptional regulator FtsR [Egicoccus halophilus]|uniref:MerR family transcriptional regulator n=1 Tax=Egicoccus halophilus TaxID=1670830 RepID=A0A8J3A8T0_9ACTN|nr:MerR family transcriptional regulator [Egicoccus halophilus]GGI04879.1 MerR family transcriptional regulator [Egicoccus halophilus]